MLFQKYKLILFSVAFVLACSSADEKSEDSNGCFNCENNKVSNQTTSNNNETTNNKTIANNDSKEAGPEFIFVANLFRAQCAQGSCHGAQSNNGLVSTGIDATDREVFEALTTQTRSVDGQLFVIAGDAGNSNLVDRMEREMANLGFMPLGGQKDQFNIDKIKEWINQGASFN